MFKNFFKRKSKINWPVVLGIDIPDKINFPVELGIDMTIESSPAALTIHDENQEKIMSIGTDGQLKWYKENSADEAVAIFANAYIIHVENEAGIKQNRKEWELRITKALARRAEKEPLTPEVLTNTIRKCILLDTLKGIK